MIRIHHVPHFRSVRVIWLMEELGEPYEVVLAPTDVNADFKMRTGVVAIPAIEDDGVAMGESIAILQYLTGRRIQKSLALGLTVGPTPDPAAYAEHLHWLHFGEASLMVHLAMLSRSRRNGDGGSYAAGACERILEGRLGALERRLDDGRSHLTGEAFTIADISIGYALGYGRYRELDGMFGPKTTAYLERVTARPGYRAAIAA